MSKYLTKGLKEYLNIFENLILSRTNIQIYLKTKNQQKQIFKLFIESNIIFFYHILRTSTVRNEAKKNKKQKRSKKK